MARTVRTNVFGRDVRVDLEDEPGDDGSAGVREPLRPLPDDDVACAEADSTNE